MKLKSSFIIMIGLFATSCTVNQPNQVIRPILSTAAVTNTSPPTLETKIPSNKTRDIQRLFEDHFDKGDINPVWKVIEGKPKIDKGLSTGKEKVILLNEITMPDEYMLQFDLNQCGNDGYVQLSIGQQLQFEFLSDLSTNIKEYQKGKWVSLQPGFAHRCAAHIAILINNSSYMVLNIHNDDVTKLLEGVYKTSINGPIELSITPYAGIDNFLITSR